MVCMYQMDSNGSISSESVSASVTASVPITENSIAPMTRIPATIRRYIHDARRQNTFMHTYIDQCFDGAIPDKHTLARLFPEYLERYGAFENMPFGAFSPLFDGTFQHVMCFDEIVYSLSRARELQNRYGSDPPILQWFFATRILGYVNAHSLIYVDQRLNDSCGKCDECIHRGRQNLNRLRRTLRVFPRLYRLQFGRNIDIEAADGEKVNAVIDRMSTVNYNADQIQRIKYYIREMQIAICNCRCTETCNCVVPRARQ